MFKWHVHSAIGRGRPTTHDFARVADGIAASLRAFSLSAQRCEGAERSRSEKSKDAFKEVSSLAPPKPRGIDARSLAAKPTFTIHRIGQLETSDLSSRPRRDYGSGLNGNRTNPGGARIPFRGSRGGARGSARGRGGDRGRGRGGDRGRGRGRGGSRKRQKRKPTPEEEELEQPFTEEEHAFHEGITMGFMQPYNPTTSMAELARLAPAVPTTAAGLREGLVYRLQVGTDNRGADYKSGSEHLQRTARGNGTLFENAEQRMITEKYLHSPNRAPGVKPGDPRYRQAGSLNSAQRSKVLSRWVAGQYDRPQPVKEGDVLAQVAAATTLNGSYLPEDAKKLQDKLQGLLPNDILPKKKIEKLL